MQIHRRGSHTAHPVERSQPLGVFLHLWIETCLVQAGHQLSGIPEKTYICPLEQVTAGSGPLRPEKYLLSASVGGAECIRRDLLNHRDFQRPLQAAMKAQARGPCRLVRGAIGCDPDLSGTGMQLSDGVCALDVGYARHLGVSDERIAHPSPSSNPIALIA